MRFPELYQKLTFVHGAQILLMPSAFAVTPAQALPRHRLFERSQMKTGEAHWETLLRCRAIECQCYVVAAAQVGQHNTTGNCRTSWGHSCVFDPWGQKVVDMGIETGIAVFEVDCEHVKQVRDNMPMHAHRRYDIYGDAPHG